MKSMRRVRAGAIALMLAVPLLGASLALAAGSPVGAWKTIDDKSGKVRSTVEVYEK